MVDNIKDSEIIPITIEEELKKSYLDYAMSVIVGRALPDVRDGLKPVHKRVLYAMRVLNNDWNKPFKKSARIVGDVIGKYHPHGDTAVYDTIVRMAQPFAMRYMLVDGQGNFGSVDGDSAAAMRYTEVRMSRFAHALLEDLDKETVDFIPNYDETETIPSVLPTRIPNLLVNGSSGIAVGMATNIPPHNLGEVIDACIALIANPDLAIGDLMEYIPGPDFPTAGIINGSSGIIQAYHTGRGRIYVRARSNVETYDNNRERIIITELPYQINKAHLIEKIAELVKNKKIEGISGLRDESNKQGMRVVIELKRGELSEVILNNLYKHTQLESVYGINIVALEDNQPRILNLKQLLEAFLKHRREVVTRRTIYDLRKARARIHILEGLAIALANIDEIIALIKAAKTPKIAKEKLMARSWNFDQVVSLIKASGDVSTRPEGLSKHYGIVGKQYHLSPEQVQAILDLRLHRLTNLEQNKISDEYRSLLELIAELLKILSDPDRLLAVIEEELLEVKTRFADDRRTEIIKGQVNVLSEDLIPKEDVVVTLSHHGYAKTQSLENYQAQHRGGKGRSSSNIKEEDVVEHILVANSHDTILCFSNIGKVYWLKTYQIPMASRQSRGRPIVNLLPLTGDERITTILAVDAFEDDRYIFMATVKGTVKKVALSEFARPRSNGKIAIKFEDDNLVGAALTDGSQEIMLFSNVGKVIRFKEPEVRKMGRVARGIRGIRLEKDQTVVSLIAIHEDFAILTATEYGYGKRTELAEYRLTKRGGKGIISIQCSERNGNVIGAMQVSPEMEMMLISNKGSLVRIPVAEISVISRNTQGVRLINLVKEEKLIGIAKVENIDQAVDE